MPNDNGSENDSSDDSNYGIPEQLIEKLERVLDLHNISRGNVELHHREIGSAGHQFSIQVREAEGRVILWSGPWLTEEEMRIYLKGMDNLERMSEEVERTT